MINSRNDYKYYIICDRIAKGLPLKFTVKQKFTNLLFGNPVWRFQKKLRKIEYYKNCKRGILNKIIYFFLKIQFERLSIKCGFSIPPNVFGPGLSISHRGTIIVNSATRIGANCRLHACVNIGTRAGYSNLAPKIGDNCYIGPGAKIFGDIRLGNNIAIGANAVINKTNLNEDIVLAGVPAKEISKVVIRDLIIPATEIIERGLLAKYDIIVNENKVDRLEKIKKLFN